MPDVNTASVFYQPPEYVAAERLRKLPRMLLGGTDALRADSRTWLPPYSNDEEKPPLGGGQSDYDKRVTSAVVEPYYEDAVDRVVSTILSEPITLQSDVPLAIRGNTADEGEAIEGWWENIDLRGNDGNVFMREVVKDAAGEGGYSCVLVDHPPVPEGYKLSDVQAEGMRPFWRHYRAADVLEATPEYIHGRECIKRLRLRDGCDDEGNELVRVINVAPWDESTRKRVGFVTWELHRRRKNDAGEYIEELWQSGTMEPHQEIPLAVVYFDRRGFFSAHPPELHLAHLNLKHTQQDCEISDDLSISCGAQLHRAGISADEKNQRAIGKRVLLSSGKADASAEWLERSGTAARVFMDYQQRLEDKMRTLANMPLVQRSGNLTATGQAIDAAQAKTEVQARAIAVRDFVERLLTFTAIDIAGKVEGAKGGSVVVKMPAVLIQRDPDGLKLLLEMNAKLGVPLPATILKRAQAQGLLPDDFDAEAEVAMAETKVPPPAAVVAGGRPAPALDRVRAAVAAADAKSGEAAA